MSRHRAVRNIDLDGRSSSSSWIRRVGLKARSGLDALRTAKHDELDEELELTPEEEGEVSQDLTWHATHAWFPYIVQMNVSLDRVREVVGPEHESGFTDADIREALWEYYFDVDQTIDWVFGTQLVTTTVPSYPHFRYSRADEAA